MNAEENIPILLTSNIYIGLFLAKALTLAQLRAFKIFEVLLVVRANISVGLQGILNFPLLSDIFPYWLAWGILLKEGVCKPLQSKVRTPPPSFSLKNSHIADITQRMASTTCTIQERSINTPTATPDTSSSSTSVPRVTLETDSMHCIVSSPASGIPCTPTALSGIENLPTAIPNPEARTTITNPLQMRGTARYQTQRQWQLQLQVVSTPRLVVSGSRSIHRFGNWVWRGLCFNVQTPEALHVEQMAVYECKGLGDGKLCNWTCCKTISWSPTLERNGDVLEHRYAAKQHSDHSICGMHKGDFERGLLKHQPMLHSTHSNWYQVWVHVDMVTSHFIQSARDNIVELYDCHRFESNAERLELIDSLLAENK